MDFNYQEIIITALGGLAFFLFGIRYMSEGLQAVAGERMREILEKGTKTPFRGIVSGMIVTAIIQSSSATTVLTVGLVNSGLLTLRQAIGIIMGANVGTTITAYMIGFKLEEYALPVLTVGIILIFFFKNKKFTTIGQVLFGFGLIFYGMKVMGTGLKPLREMPLFINAMANIESRSLMGVLLGTVFTGIVQSSSATIGIVQELANQGAITYKQSVPILFGSNIGTTVTALLASISTSVAARRTALIHLLFNAIGVLFFLPLFSMGIFGEAVQAMTNFIYFLVPGNVGWESLNVKMQIAQTHGIFNISSALMQLPFVTILAAIVTKLVPGEDITIEIEPKYLEPRLLSNPPVALGQAGREVIRMANLAKESLDHAIAFFFTGLESESKKSNQLEIIINNLQRQITDYVVMISERTLSVEESNLAYIYVQVVNDIERVGDHAENIIELTQTRIEQGFLFSMDALAEVRLMIDKTLETYEGAITSLKQRDPELAKVVIKSDDYIDEMEKEYRRSHIERLNSGTCSGNAGATYLDLLSNLERIGDHSVNIAQYVLGER